MTDELWDKRRQQLQEAVAKAVLALLEHTGAEGFEAPLDETRVLIVRRKEEES